MSKNYNCTIIIQQTITFGEIATHRRKKINICPKYAVQVLLKRARGQLPLWEQNRQHNKTKCRRRRRRWAPAVVVNNRHGGTTSEHVNINTDRVIRYRNIIHYYYML